jgi:nitroimidazol reductase NimA-like FMN-containing flavoprotein (pyridoxamine 5'-phosphate oxidase superfamily)
MNSVTVVTMTLSPTAASQGAPVCVTVTQLRGVVYARSAFHHSMNYASAVIHGTARKVTDDKELRHGLRTLVEHLAPGSWEHPPAHPQGTRRHHGAGRVARGGFGEGPDRAALPRDMET